MDSCALSRPGAGLVRTFLITWLSVVLSACGHSVATGSAPSWSAVAIGSATVSLAVAPFARRRMTVRAGSGMLSVLQVGLHLFFTATMPTSAMPHSMGAAHGGVEGPTWLALVPTAPMLCAHLLAAAGVAWLLRGGDVAAEGVVTLARLHGANTVSSVRHAFLSRLGARRCFPGAFATLLRRAVPRWAAAPPCRRTPLVHEVTRRGPPRRTAALG